MGQKSRAIWNTIAIAKGVSPQKVILVRCDIHPAVLHHLILSSGPLSESECCE